MSDMNNPSDENSGALDDLWADALNEQKATPTKSAADAVFQQLGGGDVRLSKAILTEMRTIDGFKITGAASVTLQDTGHGPHASGLPAR